MDVVLSPEAREFINARGGAVFVRSHTHRCRGPVTLLDTATDPPPDFQDFALVDASDVIVRYKGDPVDQPHVLTIEVHGIVHRHLVSYWDGCIYKL